MGSSPASIVASPDLSHQHPDILSPTIPSLKRGRWDSDEVADDANPNSVDGHDLTSGLPDELLARVFQFLRSGDRKTCSTVCRRWLGVDGWSRHQLNLKTNPDLLSALPVIFTRFASVTRLALLCDQEESASSMSDEALVLISMMYARLQSVGLYGCRDLTNIGIASFAANCKTLRKLLCDSCDFGTKGINAVTEHCVNLEKISIKRLRGIHDSSDLVGPGAAASSLRTICLEELNNAQCFAPLLIGAKNLETLRLVGCSGNWDDVLHTLGHRNNSRLLEVNLINISVSDVGISGVANCKCVKSLVLVGIGIPRSSNVGLLAIVENCKLLRKLYIDGRRGKWFGDEGLVAIATKCVHLQELVLMRINATESRLALLASNCKGLERLGLYRIETIGDAEISCIATKCEALRMLYIKECPISDLGIESLALGCSNLVKIKVRKCEGITNQIAERLKERRGSLVFVEDNGVEEPEFF